MSQPTTRSSTKRKTKNESTTKSPKKKSFRADLNDEHSVISELSRPKPWLSSGHQRNKSFSINIDESDDSLSDKENFDPNTPIPPKLLLQIKQDNIKSSQSRLVSRSSNIPLGLSQNNVGPHSVVSSFPSIEFEIQDQCSKIITSTPHDSENTCVLTVPPQESNVSNPMTLSPQVQGFRLVTPRLQDPEDISRMILSPQGFQVDNDIALPPQDQQDTNSKWPLSQGDHTSESTSASINASAAAVSEPKTSHKHDSKDDHTYAPSIPPGLPIPEHNPNPEKNPIPEHLPNIESFDLIWKALVIETMGWTRDDIASLREMQSVVRNAWSVGNLLWNDYVDQTRHVEDRLEMVHKRFQRYCDTLLHDKQMRRLNNNK